MRIILRQKVLGWESTELFHTNLRTSGPNTVLKQKFETIQSKNDKMKDFDFQKKCSALRWAED